LPSRNREISGFRGLNEGIQRSQTVHPRTSIADNQVRYVWNYGPFFKPSGEFILWPMPDGILWDEHFGFTEQEPSAALN
jgi:hypothetical protein